MFIFTKYQHMEKRLSLNCILSFMDQWQRTQCIALVPCSKKVFGSNPKWESFSIDLACFLEAKKVRTKALG